MKYNPIQNFIGGKFVASQTKKTMEVISPLDGTLLSTVPMSSAKDLDDAVKPAKAAFPEWSKKPIKERVQVFFRYKTLLERNLQNCAAKKMARPTENRLPKLKNVLNSPSLQLLFPN